MKEFNHKAEDINEALGIDEDNMDRVIDHAMRRENKHIVNNEQEAVTFTNEERLYITTQVILGNLCLTYLYGRKLVSENQTKSEIVELVYKDPDLTDYDLSMLFAATLMSQNER